MWRGVRRPECQADLAVHNRSLHCGHVWVHHQQKVENCYKQLVTKAGCCSALKRNSTYSVTLQQSDPQFTHTHMHAHTQNKQQQNTTECNKSQKWQQKPLRCWYMRRFGNICMAEENGPNLISHGSRVSIAVWKKLLFNWSVHWFQPVHSKYSMIHSKQMYCIHQPVSAHRLDWSEGKARGHKGR